MPIKIPTAVRPLLALLAAATLAACAGGNQMVNGVQPAAANSQAAVAAPEAPSPAPEPSRSRRPPAAGRGQSAYVPPPAPEASEPPVTVEVVNGQCWMETEKDRRARDIDKRVQLVEECVKAKMKKLAP